MKVAIYNSVNGAAPLIGWWLATDARMGPQLYEDTFHIESNEKNIGTSVNEIRSYRAPHILSNDNYDRHQETLRRMENLDAVNGVSDCLQPFDDIENHYDICIWSNYFGDLKEIESTIKADKTILVKTSNAERQFFYISNYAFNAMKKDLIDDHSKIWWEDHMLMNGEILGNWKEIWYNKYHNYMHEQFDKGVLKYMWQLNYAHWDLYHAIADGHDDIEFVHCDDIDRLFNERNDAEDIESTIKAYDDLGQSYIVVGDNWYENPEKILNYIGIDMTTELQRNLDNLIDDYTKRKTLYNSIFSDYVD